MRHWQVNANTNSLQIDFESGDCSGEEGRKQKTGWSGHRHRTEGAAELPSTWHHDRLDPSKDQTIRRRVTFRFIPSTCRPRKKSSSIDFASLNSGTFSNCSPTNTKHGWARTSCFNAAALGKYVYERIGPNN